MNVLHVCKYYYPVTGGIQKLIRTICENLPQVNFRILASRPSGRGKRISHSEGTAFYTTSLGNIKSTPLSPTFPYHLRKHIRWADVVHYHLPFPVSTVSHLLNRSGDTPVVVTFHDDIVGKGPVVYPYRPVLTRFLDYADSIIVTSPNMRDHCEQIAKFRDKVEVVPIGIELEDVNETPRELDGNHVLFVGRLVPFKGARYLVSAMKFVDAELTIVGDGPQRNELERLAADENVGQTVTFEGHVSNERLLQLYKTASAFVLPSVSNNESFGIVQLEALKHGLPVINTALDTGVPFVSVDGETGYTVTPRNEREIAEALERLFNNPRRYRRFSKNAHERVDRKFKRSDMIRDTLEIYRSVSRARS